MQDPEDTVTGDIIDPETGEILPAKRGRGRPPGSTPPMTGAERTRRYRAALKEDGMRPVIIYLAPALAEALDAMAETMGISRSDLLRGHIENITRRFRLNQAAKL